MPDFHPKNRLGRESHIMRWRPSSQHNLGISEIPRFFQQTADCQVPRAQDAWSSHACSKSGGSPGRVRPSDLSFHCYIYCFRSLNQVGRWFVHIDSGRYIAYLQGHGGDPAGIAGKIFFKLLLVFQLKISLFKLISSFPTLWVIPRGILPALNYPGRQVSIRQSIGFIPSS